MLPFSLSTFPLVESRGCGILKRLLRELTTEQTEKEVLGNQHPTDSIAGKLP